MADRIQKVLARAGIASRRQVEEWIKAGRLAVNGVPVKLGAQWRPHDRITLDGRPVRVREPDPSTRVIMYHRAASRDVTAPDTAESVQLFERLPKRGGRRWIAVSPLPPSDGGLELLTNDGDLAQRLMRRLGTLRVTFSLRVRGELNEQQLARLRSGVVDPDTTLKVESIESAGGEGSNRWYTLVTLGGRARDVHRLAQAAGVDLSRLMRVELGPLRMERGLARERHRDLSPAEAAQLYELVGVSSVAQAATAPSTRSRPRSLARYKA